MYTWIGGRWILWWLLVLGTWFLMLGLVALVDTWIGRLVALVAGGYCGGSWYLALDTWYLDTWNGSIGSMWIGILSYFYDINMDTLILLQYLLGYLDW